MNIKKASILAAASLALAGLAGAANATTWQASYTGAGSGTYVDDSHPLTFTLDITTPAAGSYRPGIDTLSSLSFSFVLADDNNDGLFTSYESGDIDVLALGDSGSKSTDFDSGDLGGTIGFNIAPGLLAQWDLGKYQVTISADPDSFLAYDKDFLVKSAKVVANGTTGATSPTHVPEPTSLALIGLSLLGAGAAARRKKK